MDYLQPSWRTTKAIEQLLASDRPACCDTNGYLWSCSPKDDLIVGKFADCQSLNTIVGYEVTRFVGGQKQQHTPNEKPAETTVVRQINSPVDGGEYFSVLFFSQVDSGEEQRKTRERREAWKENHVVTEKPGVCSHPEDQIKPEETLRCQNIVGVRWRWEPGHWDSWVTE